MTGSIFISYRRDDTKAEARSIFERLQRGPVGRRRLFMDVDDIERGRDFRAVLDAHLGQCAALLALIGPNWLDARDAAGRRRLDDPSDFVRLEIGAALARGVPVVPVLLDNAQLPAPEALPDDLKPLCFRQAARVAHESFGRDMQALEVDLGRLLKLPSKSWRAPAMGGVGGMVVAGAPTSAAASR